jgi:peptidyl-prolyl cis-trans isomerase D
MELFRKLGENIFFKIILGFVALSFVLFGISEFIFGNPNNWVAKVGGTTIGYNSFNKALQNDREIIQASSKGAEVAQFLESDEFKSEVLGRLVNKIMIEKLRERLGVEASKKLIFQAIAKNHNFKNSAGKFDRDLFKKFLAQNRLTEERYIEEVSGEIEAMMIIQTLALVSPINEAAAFELEDLKQEKRLADVITISTKNLKSVAAPTKEEIAKYFENNKAKYVAPEFRSAAYIQFSKQDFASEYKVSKEEILAQYQASKDQLTRPETRNFYHVLFEKEEAAKDFLAQLNSASGDKKAEFAKLAKSLAKKDLAAISLKNISQKDLLPDLTQSVFKLQLAQHSEVLKSPLGFHIFLLTEIKAPQLIPLAEVEQSIKSQLLQSKHEKLLQEKISAIDDLLLTSNSLEEVAKKFGLKVSKSIKIDAANKNEAGLEVLETKDLSDFSSNVFLAKKGQTSKIFYAKGSESFYAFKVEEVQQARQKNVEEVSAQIDAELSKENRSKALRLLAATISSEAAASPEKFTEIAAKNGLKLERNREFPKSYFIKSGDRQIPYQNAFLTNLFKLQVGQVTDLVPAGEGEFVVGILRQVKHGKASEAQLSAARESAMENFKTEILQEYNKILLEANPVKINEKFFPSSAK